ncbi:hypothetical protein [Draconibacterium sp.]|uniref:hypothetical protein n=1 Tax=Draconibacterium sp. TaxID=1965318 RepID=UPI0035614851
MDTQEAKNQEEVKAAGSKVKTPVQGTEAAPLKDKTGNAPEASEAPTGDDITNVVMLLNEFDKISGGSGEIADVPENLRGPVKFLVDKMVALRDAYYDPLFKAILDDLVDQQEDGMTPSVKVAVARTIPLNELQELADSEEYGAVQQGLADTKTAADEEARNDEELFAKLDKSKANHATYCESMGYDETEGNALWEEYMNFLNAQADGEITETEWEKFDKQRNYDADMSAMKAQLPPEPTKTIVPDKSSVDTSRIPNPQPADNQTSAMAYAQQGPSYQDVGKRKIFKSKNS